MDCKKTKYSIKQSALDDIERIKNVSTREVIPLRAYLCKICNTWHLTSALSKQDIFMRELQQENRNLREETKLLKQQTISKIDHDAQVDIKCKKLGETINQKQKEIKRLKTDNSDLIAKLIQLEKNNSEKT